MQLALSLALLCFTACTPIRYASPRQDASPQEAAMAGAILNSRRAASLAGWEHKTIRGEPVLTYSLQRTAIVLPPGVKMTHHTKREGNMLRFEARFQGQDKNLFTASAAAITADGYFLTAAHCLDQGACTLVALTRGGELQVAPARVVWCGLLDKGGPDLGLVHAAIIPARTIPIAAFPAEPKGTLIFTSGFGAHGPGGSGGHVVHAGRVQKRAGGVRWREIYHDAPLAPGDSGGPLVNEEGRLVGINIQIRGKWQRNDQAIALTNYTGVAVSPDPGWVHALIVSDRAARRTAAARAPR